MDLPQIGALGELEQVLASFLRKNERVLLCFPGPWEPVGQTAAECVKRAGGVPVFWGGDLLWKSLLWNGFRHRCATVIGAPDILLGLSKLSRRAATPLYIRNAVVLGDAPDDWLRGSICDGLDCKIRGWIPGAGHAAQPDSKVRELLRELRRWTTILDMKVEKSGPGLSLELVTFPGEKLPKLPSFGRLVVRDWDADRDMPLDVPLQWKTGIFSQDDH